MIETCGLFGGFEPESFNLGNGFVNAKIGGRRSTAQKQRLMQAESPAYPK